MLREKLQHAELVRVLSRRSLMGKMRTFAVRELRVEPNTPNASHISFRRLLLRSALDADVVEVRATTKARQNSSHRVGIIDLKKAEHYRTHGVASARGALMLTAREVDCMLIMRDRWLEMGAPMLRWQQFAKVLP